MANLIKLRKGLDINLKGKATTELIKVKEPGFYAICPDDFTGVTPKVVVKENMSWLEDPCLSTRIILN